MNSSCRRHHRGGDGLGAHRAFCPDRCEQDIAAGRGLIGPISLILARDVDVVPAALRLRCHLQCTRDNRPTGLRCPAQA
jgi:hypothetical protein